jgi:hypothetical protein
MRWQGRRGSTNVEDRRGGGRGLIFGGGIGGLILFFIFTFLGGDPSSLTNGWQTAGNDPPPPYEETEQESELKDFVSVVLADTEDVWTDIFKERGMIYKKPTLVLYSGSVQSACGSASSAVGPFYCPGDEKLYIDLSFYDELQRRFQAPGDFAMAYVIAHEVGHHVQNQLGISGRVMSLRSRLSEEEFNQYSVRLELQADYLAGVWAKHAEGMGVLEQGDMEEAIHAASAVGDDTLQKRARGYAVPESFTHGTSEQRMRWFKRGYEYGDLEHGDTFGAGRL